MDRRFSVVLAAAALVILASPVVAFAAPPAAAPAQPAAGQRIAVPQPTTFVCPPMVQATSQQQGDWVLFSFQGWLTSASYDATHRYFTCHYGLDQAAPANRPAVDMGRPVPANLTNCQLDTAAKSLNCQLALAPR